MVYVNCWKWLFCGLFCRLGDYLVESGENKEAVDVYAACADRLRSAGPDEIDDIKVSVFWECGDIMRILI